MECKIRKGLTGLLAGSMLFLSGFATAGEAAEPAEEGEKSDEGAVIGTLSSIMEFYDSCVEGLTSALGAVLLFL